MKEKLVLTAFLLIIVCILLLLGTRLAIEHRFCEASYIYTMTFFAISIYSAFTDDGFDGNA